MRRLPPLNALKTFEAVARLSSITRASEELGVSHSSVSQQVRVLEDYFGQKLFLRQGRCIKPTALALAYMEQVRTSLDRIAVASADLTTYGKQRPITLNATPSFAMRWLIPRTADFQISNPTIGIKIHTSMDDSIDTLSNIYDLVFRRDRMEQRDHVCHRILDDLQTPVLAPEILRKHTIAVPEDLTKLTILHMRSRPTAWEKWFELAGVGGLPPIDGPVFDHFFLSLQAAINGHGVAIGSRALIEDDLEANKLVAPFPHDNIEGPGYHVLYRPELADDRAGEQILKWLSRTTAFML